MTWFMNSCCVIQVYLGHIDYLSDVWFEVEVRSGDIADHLCFKSTSF